MEKQHLIDIAAKKKKAAVVFKDVAVIDVYSRETIRTDVAILSLIHISEPTRRS